MVWTHFKVATWGQQLIQWPGLHNQVFITLYEKPYAAVWATSPGHRHRHLVTAILTALATGVVRSSSRRYHGLETDRCRR
jgi:lactate permease